VTTIARFWRNLFDVRPGEGAKTGFMALYLMLVLFAYYILKPVSRSLFLKNFDIDKLPWLYILIAGVGGLLAYLYTKLAVRSSLSRAVDFANVFCTGVLVLFWWLTQIRQAWVLYAFNVWVSLFSVMLVAQGWLVAANVFTPREAKRLYGLLGVGSVIGAAFGGQFTAWAVYEIGTRNLTLVSAGFVILSYIAYRFAIRSAGRSLQEAKGAEEQASFSFGEILTSIRQYRHLQVIVAIITITFMVDVMVEFQFSAFAKATYTGQTELTAFLGNFYGFWLNLITFVLQLFLTGFVVSRFGVGGALQIMPVSIAAASIGALAAPGLLSTGAARLTEASTRYSFNKTGMELLYLPLPLELRNRTKAFVDVFVDRLARGLGGMVLIFLLAIQLPHERFGAVVLCFAIVWILLSIVAQREYVATVRKRLEVRRLDLENARISVREPATIALLEKTVRGENGRQAAYALSLLSEAADSRFEELLAEAAQSKVPELRAKAFEIGAEKRTRALTPAAEAEVRNAVSTAAGETAQQAVRYLIETAVDKKAIAGQLLQHPNPGLRRAAIAALANYPEVARELIDYRWLRDRAADKDPRVRTNVAIAIRAYGDRGTEALHRLLSDPDVSVAREAIRTAGILRGREYVDELIALLADARLRGEAIESIVCYESGILGTLTDILADPDSPVSVRRQIPRVLRRIPDQRSVGALFDAVNAPDLILRTNVLKALNRLRENAPGLDYGGVDVTALVHQEAKHYFELHTSLAPLRQNGGGPASRLLVRTLDDRLNITLERVFRLLGLRYPPKQIYAAYLALKRSSGDEHAAAIEFLDNVLERELKKVLLPLLDEDAVLAQHARDLFRIECPDAEAALRELIRGDDAWLSACAMAAAAELKARSLLGDVRAAKERGGREVAQVAQYAEGALA
jgi:AAA family ATP:ADP antiporter